METFKKLAIVATVLAFCVIVLGAYVRLSDAGLGCPDWPGCYGQVTWPQAEQEVMRANEQFPQRPVQYDKAWKEMVHRYLAGGLGLLILALAIIATSRWRRPLQPLILPWALVGLVIFQALLGMWTVTLLLKPAVVLAHLLGGVTTFGLLAWLSLRSTNRRLADPPASAKKLKPWIVAACVLLVLQIALGGWTSANYAAMACTDFPTCLDSWWPEANFKEGFVLWREVGVNYEGGILDHPSRVAIHLSHRIGALIVFLYMSLLAIKMWRTPALDVHGKMLFLVLLAQVSLGILNVIMLLPLPVAVAHTGGASLLLLVLLLALNRAWPRKDY